MQKEVVVLTSVILVIVHDCIINWWYSKDMWNIIIMISPVR